MIRHFVLTLDGTAQRLSDALPCKQVDGQDDHLNSIVTLQPNGANANPVFLGSTSAITSSDYGLRLEAAAAGVPPAPLVLGDGHGQALKLSEFYAKGTNTEKLHIQTVS